MAVLTAKKRKALPDSDFAVIKYKIVKGKKKKFRMYPEQDEAHARLAVQMRNRKQSAEKPKLTSKDKKKIVSMAKKRYNIRTKT